MKALIIILLNIAINRVADLLNDENEEQIEELIKILKEAKDYVKTL